MGKAPNRYPGSPMRPETPTPPFTVYTIDECGEMATAEVIRITSQGWWFGRRTGLAFHCLVRSGPGSYPLSAADAWAAYYTRALADKTDAEQRMVAAEKAIEAL